MYPSLNFKRLRSLDCDWASFFICSAAVRFFSCSVRSLECYNAYSLQYVLCIIYMQSLNVIPRFFINSLHQIQITAAPSTSVLIYYSWHIEWEELPIHSFCHLRTVMLLPSFVHLIDCPWDAKTMASVFVNSESRTSLPTHVCVNLRHILCKVDWLQLVACVHVMVTQ